MADQVKDRVKETGQEALDRGRQVAQDVASTAADTAKQSAQEHGQELADSARQNAQDVRSEASSSSPRRRGAVGRDVPERTEAGAAGREAERPSQIPPRGWFAVLKRVKAEVKEDNVSLLAAGIAFYAMLAIFPAIIALVTIYGMVADPAQVESQVGGFAKSLPSGADQLITEQLKNVVNAGQQSLSIGLALSLLAVLWSVSSGVQGLVKALNVVYDERETRGFVEAARPVAAAHPRGHRGRGGRPGPDHGLPGRGRQPRAGPGREAGRLRRPLGRPGPAGAGRPGRGVPVRPGLGQPALALGERGGRWSPWCCGC